MEGHSGHLLIKEDGNTWSRCYGTLQGQSLSLYLDTEEGRVLKRLIDVTGASVDSIQKDGDTTDCLVVVGADGSEIQLATEEQDKAIWMSSLRDATQRVNRNIMQPTDEHPLSPKNASDEDDTDVPTKETKANTDERQHVSDANGQPPFVVQNDEKPQLDDPSLQPLSPMSNLRVVDEYLPEKQHRKSVAAPLLLGSKRPAGIRALSSSQLSSNSNPSDYPKIIHLLREDENTSVQVTVNSEEVTVGDVARSVAGATVATYQTWTLYVRDNTSMQEKMIDLQHYCDDRHDTVIVARPFLTTEAPLQLKDGSVDIVKSSETPRNDGVSALSIDPRCPWEKLLSGEATLFFRNLTRLRFSTHRNYNSVNGTLYVTNFRLFFIDEDHPSSMAQSIPLCNIRDVRRYKRTKNSRAELPSSLNAVEIICKDLRSLVICAGKGSTVSAKFVRDIIDAIPACQEKLFAFHWKHKFEGRGWSVYNATEEYKRLGLPNGKWRITRVNEEFKMSASYPPLLVVPASVTDEELLKVAEFRSRGRIPACIWRHAKNGAALLRCSQPGTGLRRSRCVEDEKLLDQATEPETEPTPNSPRLVMEEPTQRSQRAQTMATPSSPGRKNTKITRKMSIGVSKKEIKPKVKKPLYISDSRPKVNAQVNVLKGFGYENMEMYSNATLEFWNIDNIHVMRSSLKKAANACRYEFDATEYNKSQWSEHIKRVMGCSLRIAELLDSEGITVLAHCTDGWDRTAQNVALAELLLDPYYRSLDGFIVLVEKEFLSFGHKAAIRIGHDSDNIYSPKDKERSPIFLQFLDCVWQVLRQLPNYFEFKEELLVCMSDHTQSCLFGTFLCNNEAERKNEKIPEKTASLWDFIHYNRPHFVNPSYAPVATSVYPLYTKFNVSEVKPWLSVYGRWCRGATGEEYTSTPSFTVLYKSIFIRQYRQQVAPRTLSPATGDLYFHVSLSGNTVTALGNKNSACSGTPLNGSLTSTLGACLSTNQTHGISIKAYMGPTFQPAPGPHDTISFKHDQLCRRTICLSQGEVYNAVDSSLFCGELIAVAFTASHY
ncbi:myotubularin-related protein 2 isoform 1 [Planoprotostelium fungivorum]|uniref:Myotubularin-related protein 2 isoform 1 n=1 Tax=Planoprotostelium fungivorum TaxID=1890364 RepID=A0A2P6NWD4_9EUKA|nr:myotubularin-related protein 2 isoform 1 [Planoprotostelium fungivorum]